MATVRATCATSSCDVSQTVTVSNTAGDRVQLREGLVQDLFPDLSLQEREVVMGARNKYGYYCGPCWDKMFPSEDEE